MKLDASKVAFDVRLALAEDVGSGDVTATLLPSKLDVHAQIISREPMVVCGTPWVNEVFFQVNNQIHVDWLVEEGDYLLQAQPLCRIHGNAQAILTAERTALNFLQTLSATATKTKQFVDLLQGSHTKLLDTRKTIPGLRMAQKYAVRCAGGVNHRIGLYDAFLIKENHIKACGSITNAIEKARAMRPSLFVEVEVENLNELAEALAASPDRILLDNFTIPMIEQAVSMNQHKHCSLEVSGGVTLESISQLAATGVDFISAGQITKSVQAIDLSLLIMDVL
jgi:nicotinate-nucleotide pyrophosphorylase (carboxylating)